MGVNSNHARDPGKWERLKFSSELQLNPSFTGISIKVQRDLGRTLLKIVII